MVIKTILMLVCFIGATISGALMFDYFSREDDGKAWMMFLLCILCLSSGVAFFNSLNG